MIAERRALATLALAVVTAALAACGGGGAGRDVDGGDQGGGGAGGGGSVSTFANRCAPTNTLARQENGLLKSGYRDGTLADERGWVRAMMNADYLWFNEMPVVDEAVAAYNVVPAELALTNYFQALRTPALTPSGKRKDAYSFTMATEEWDALIEDGVVGGYGFELLVYSSRAPRDVRVAFTQPGSVAQSAGVLRGDRVIAITANGRTIDAINTTVQSEIDALNDLLYSPAPGTQISLQLRPVSGADRVVSLTAGAVTTQPVLLSKVIDRPLLGRVGYLLFNDFMTPSEGQLVTAFQQFSAAAVDELVVDMRYNGGGYIYIASQLAYMIAGNDASSGKTFERTVYNSRRGGGGVQPFRRTALGRAGSGVVPGTVLPELALKRVTVLTSPGTCSASETVINGLRGIDIEVALVGGETCGKPYGFQRKENCGQSYFPVEFQGLNAKGFGDFADGFQPTCRVADDLTRPLGDEAEGMLSVALARLEGQACPSAAIASKSVDSAAGALGSLLRSPARSNGFRIAEPSADGSGGIAPTGNP